MVTRILVALDGSPLAESILPYVRGVAAGVGAEVVLGSVLHVSKDTLSSLTGSKLDQVVARDRALIQTYLDGVAQRLATDGLAVRTVVGFGNAADEIVRLAGAENADLIALATHGRSGIDRWVHGSVAEAVLQIASTPVLLIHPADYVVSQSVQQLVIPLDGSPLAEAALAEAVTLATAMKTPLALVRVVEPVYLAADPAAGIMTDYGNLLDDMQGAARAYLDEQAAALTAQGLTVTTAVPIGTPAKEIVDFAQAHPGSLIVIATHGRTGVAGILLGSVARRVVQQAGAPTMLVQAPKDE
ncbi:MAG: universal stress protein [Chloroflexi bacterium]|nr:universal stress protein [Chloroflexota bacterium]